MELQMWLIMHSVAKKKIVVGWIKKDEQFFFKIQKVSEKSRKE